MSRRRPIYYSVIYPPEDFHEVVEIGEPLSVIGPGFHGVEDAEEALREDWVDIQENGWAHTGAKRGTRGLGAYVIECVNGKCTDYYSFDPDHEDGRVDNPGFAGMVPFFIDMGEDGDVFTSFDEEDEDDEDDSPRRRRRRRRSSREEEERPRREEEKEKADVYVRMDDIVSHAPPVVQQEVAKATAGADIPPIRPEERSVEEAEQLLEIRRKGPWADWKQLKRLVAVYGAVLQEGETWEEIEKNKRKTQAAVRRAMTDWLDLDSTPTADRREEPVATEEVETEVETRVETPPPGEPADVALKEYAKERDLGRNDKAHITKQLNRRLKIPAFKNRYREDPTTLLIDLGLVDGTARQGEYPFPAPIELVRAYVTTHSKYRAFNKDRWDKEKEIYPDFKAFAQKALKGIADSSAFEGMAAVQKEQAKRQKRTNRAAKQARREADLRPFSARHLDPSDPMSTAFGAALTQAEDLFEKEGYTLEVNGKNEKPFVLISPEGEEMGPQDIKSTFGNEALHSLGVLVREAENRNQRIDPMWIKLALGGVNSKVFREELKSGRFFDGVKARPPGDIDEIQIAEQGALLKMLMEDMDLQGLA